MKEITIVVLTVTATFAVCFLIFKIILKKSLAEFQRKSSTDIEELLTSQSTELTRRCQERFQLLISDINHKGEIPASATILGLINVTGLGLNKVLTDLEKQYENQDYDTRLIISRLRQITTEEMPLFSKVMETFLSTKRSVLNDYNHDQGIIK